MFLPFLINLRKAFSASKLAKDIALTRTEMALASSAENVNDKPAIGHLVLEIFSDGHKYVKIKLRSILLGLVVKADARRSQRASIFAQCGTEVERQGVGVTVARTTLNRDAPGRHRDPQPSEVRDWPRSVPHKTKKGKISK